MPSFRWWLFCPLLILPALSAHGFTQNFQHEYDQIKTIEPGHDSQNSEPEVRAYDCPDKRIALTFDDGPWGRHTLAILDILREKQAKATFFVVGARIASEPGLVRQIHNDGHELALHSYSHADLRKLDEHSQDREMRNSYQALQNAVPGIVPLWWRAPYGNLTQVSLRTGRHWGMEHMAWTIDTQDWKRPQADQLINAVLRRARDQDVVLMHDHSQSTHAALPFLIDQLRRDGFEFRTLTELPAPACGQGI